MLKDIKILVSFCSLLLLIACKKSDDSTEIQCNTPNLSQLEPTNTDGYIVKIDETIFPGEWNFKSLQSILTNNLIGTSKINGFYTDVFQGFAINKLSNEDLVSLNNLPWVIGFETAKGMVKQQQNCSEEPIDMGSQTPDESKKVTNVADGTGKRAWVVDTGIDTTHNDLNININLSRSFTENSALNDIGVFMARAIQDGDGHGTHVSGIIAAKNNSIGVIGVAYNAEIIAIKVLNDQGQGSSIDLLQGLDYVFRNANAGDVCNLSLGGGASSFIDESVRNLGRKGIFVSIAAGNDAENAQNTSPARANGQNIYTISAINNDLVFASFSNFGNPPVDFAEPGIAVLSTFKGNQYARLSGTSMAAPHLAGILLLNGNNVRVVGTAKQDPDDEADAVGAL